MKEVTVQYEVAKQVIDLTKQVSLLVHKGQCSREQCDYCGMNGHSARAFINVEQPTSHYKEAHFMGAYRSKQPVKNDPYSNTYNPGWRNHPKFFFKRSGYF